MYLHRKLFDRYSYSWAIDYIDSYVAASAPFSSPTCSSSSAPFRWLLPPFSCWKLNTNASFDLDMHRAGFGAIVRNSNDNFLGGFSEVSGGCFDAFAAESSVLLLGLLLLVQLGCLTCIVNSDCLNSINLINKGSVPINSHGLGITYLDILDLVSFFSCIFFLIFLIRSLTYDRLAHFGLSSW